MTFCLSAAILVVGFGGSARAAFVDQSYLPTTGQGFNTSASSNLPIGQEFTPTTAALDFVDLFIADAGSDTGPGASFRINIRSGSITGAILGTSNTLSLPDNFNQGIGSYAAFTPAEFTFAAPVTLVPGQLSVIEVVQVGPFVVGNSNFLVYGGPFGGSTYAGGRAIVGGTPQTNFDLAFREGVLNPATVPEPSSLALCGIAGLIGWGVRARRRRS